MRAAVLHNGVVVNVIEVASVSDGMVHCPDVSVGIGHAYHDATGLFSAPPLSDEQVKQLLTDAVQFKLDASARERGYDNILSVCSYAAVANPFQAEGTAFLEWRSACWAACYAILADVQAGNRPAPTAVELLAELPALVLS